MSERSSIEWTDVTWNPVVGCTKVSAGCENCYAMRMSHRLAAIPATAKDYGGLTRMVNDRPDWTNRVRCLPERLELPFGWKNHRCILVSSMSDLFHPDVPEDFIDRVFAVMALCPRHVFHVLTKRPERMREVVHRLARSISPLENAARAMGYTFRWEGISLLPWPISWIWLGVSVEDQATADQRIPILLDTPATVRFVSYEPALEAVDLQYAAFNGADSLSALEGLHWFIAGGEFGPHARPSHPDWFRAVRDQCQVARVPFFFKQWGEWIGSGEFPPGLSLSGMEKAEEVDNTMMFRVGKRAAGRLLDGRTWDEYPLSRR